MKKKSPFKWELPIPTFCYTPSPVPSVDRDGNVVSYEHPLVIPCSLSLSDSVRVKNHCNEIGLSADPNNVTGFRRMIDIINQNRNLVGSGVVRFGCDDLDVMQQAEHSLNSLQGS